jgi:hypothetical protein
MTRHSRALCLLTAITLAGPVAAAGPLDIIPEDAVCSFSIKNLDALKEKGDKFLDDPGLQEIFKRRFWQRPSELFEFGYEQLKITKTVDRHGSAAIFLASPKVAGQFNLFGSSKPVVIVVPFKDRDAMGAGFGLEKGELKEDTVVKLNKAEGVNVTCAYSHGNHLFLGFDEKVLEAVSKAKSLGSQLTPEVREIQNSADFLFHINPALTDTDWSKQGPDWEHHPDLTDPKEKEAARLVDRAFTELRYAFIGFHVEKDGLGVKLSSVFAKDNQDAKKLLAALHGDGEGSNLKGLPTGKVLAAYGARTNGPENVLMVRMMSNWFLSELMRSAPVFSAPDRPLIIGTFSEIWKNTRGQRLALYANTDPAEQGLFSAVMILDADDPKKLLDEVAELARFAEGKDLDLSDKSVDAAQVRKLIQDLGSDSFEVRETAQTKLALIGERVQALLEKAMKSDDAEVRRRAETLVEEMKERADLRRKEAVDQTLPHRIQPGFVLARQAEKRDGQAVDVVNIKLGKEDAAAVAQLRDLFGPDWMKIRVATVGKQVVVLVGSDVTLLDQCVKNVKMGAPGLAGEKVLSAFAKRPGTDRKAEVHFALEAVAPFGTTGDVSKLKEAAGLSSLTLRVDADRLGVDLWLPRPAFKVLLGP